MKTANASEAWFRIYRPSTRATAQVSACRALKKPHIRKRYNQLLERQMKKSDITVDKVLADYEYALNLAKEQGKSGEIVNAAQAQAKLVGLLRDRVETGNVGDFGDINSVADILEIVAKEAGPEAALALSTVFGLTPETKKPKAEAQSDLELLASESPSDALN